MNLHGSLKGQTMSEPLFDAFYEFSQSAIKSGEGAMPTAFVCGVEYLDSNGEYWFAVIDDGKSPKWKKIGMLYHALDEISESEQMESGEEEDDE